MNLYALLGVNRNASPDEVERAYRRLARRYHPGINPGDRDAEQMYEQIQQAYSVLGHPERRREYDRGAAPAATTIETTVSFAGFDFSTPAQGPMAATFSELFSDVFQDAAREAIAPSRGADLEARVELSFLDAIRGAQVPISIVRRERCAACAGSGLLPRPAVTCTACGGSGSRRWARGHMVFTKNCERCGGEGRVSVQPCGGCGASGLQARSEVVTLTTPPGLEAGSRLAIPGRGHAGARGGPAGDLYVAVDVGEHPYFRRAGRDLLITVPIAVQEAAFGARIDVPTLDGRVRLRIPPGTTSGQRLRVSGYGVPATAGAAAGDLIAEVQIVLPPLQDDRSRELLREFARLNPADVRGHLFE
jgi:molecular chaperone DnaJ